MNARVLARKNIWAFSNEVNWVFVRQAKYLRVVLWALQGEAPGEWSGSNCSCQVTGNWGLAVWSDGPRQGVGQGHNCYEQWIWCSDKLRHPWFYLYKATRIGVHSRLVRVGVIHCDCVTGSHMGSILKFNCLKNGPAGEPIMCDSPQGTSSAHPACAFESVLSCWAPYDLPCFLWQVLLSYWRWQIVKRKSDPLGFSFSCSVPACPWLCALAF